eukprot:TRINITY_DN1207_c0_g1_i3.p2 TRINITY_DN1207_c0_g1~~TRINITY_DN1207_c0_g1_i3.p2  ORF type:complete len:191 (-),score=26.82 TRINITY_DN1207_c0_g1_i3:229-801(-)
MRASHYNIEIFGVREHNEDNRRFYLAPQLWPIGPDVWLVQVDNSGKDNKNCWMMGFFAVLVKLGWFKEIVVSFLLTGHTHEDVDQDFSVMWRYLERRTVLDIAQLDTHLRECFIGAGNTKKKSLAFHDHTASDSDNQNHTAFKFVAGGRRGRLRKLLNEEKKQLPKKKAEGGGEKEATIKSTSQQETTNY